MGNMMLAIWSVILIIQSICDIRWKKIPFGITVVGIGIGIFYCILNQRAWGDILWGLIPGIACIGYSYISREALGIGDSLLLCALGFVIEIEHMLLIMMLAFGFAAFAGLFIFVFFQKKRDYEVPFVPFLLVGFFIDVVIQIGGRIA